MRSYESVIMFQPGLTEEEQQQKLDFFKSIITSRKGEVSKEESWGKLRLEYPIQKHMQAHYHLIRFAGNHEITEEMKRRFKFDEDLIRYVIVAIDEKKFKTNPKNESSKPRRRYEDSNRRYNSSDNNRTPRTPAPTPEPVSPVKPVETDSVSASTENNE